MKRLIPLCALLLGAVLVTSPAEAQQNCAPRDHVILRLANLYGETPRGMGLDGNHHLVEVYASEEHGTWSIVVTNPTGVSCLVGSGHGWEPVKAVAPEGDPL